MDFDLQIQPFFWVEHDSGQASLCLSAGRYLPELFDSRAEEGFVGNGYDWASLAQVFLDERMPNLTDLVRFDPEAGMFTAYSDNREALRRFALAFKAACEDDKLIADLFSRAELD